MYKSKRQKNKSFDWYGLSQRFSIRKYHFGAASVLLGTALILGAAQTTAKAEEATTENKTEAVTPTSKDAEAAATPANVTLPATEATTGAPVLDKKELSEEEIAKLAAEVSKKDEKASETDTAEKTEVSDKEKATLTAPSTDKKVDKTVDEKADKKDEKKAENPITATKKILEQLTSEAEVLNTTAANYAEKKVEDKSSKEAIAAAVATAKTEIAASKKALEAGEITKAELDAQLQRISSAIEAVYAEMKRGGHIGKVEAVLAETNAENAGAKNNPPKELTVIKNPMELDDEEELTIIRNVRNANPGLTSEDQIIVSRTGANGNAGGVTIKYADGSPSVSFSPGNVVTSTAGAKNLEQLSDSINWFDFATAKITYTDGSTASRVKYLDNAVNKTLTGTTGSTGRTFTGKFTMYREVTLGKDYVVDGVTYAKGTKISTLDDAFLKMGIAKYEQHIYYSGSAQNGGEIYEVLQEGMKFNVPTKVEGYNLVATVAKLGPKTVATDLAKEKGYTGNTLRYRKDSPTGTESNSLYNLVDAPDGGGRRTDILLTTINKDYSYLEKAGISTAHREYKEGDSDYKPTGEKRDGLVSFTSSRDNSNFGVTLSLSATYNGVPVAVNAIVADGDESGNREFSQFETDGSNWSELMELHWDNRQVDANKKVVEAANGNLVVTDNNGDAYLDSKGNPIIINRTKQVQEETVQEGANSYTRYYLTSADGYKVVVSEKSKALALDESGNPYVYDKSGALSTTTKAGMFKDLEDGTRKLVDGEGRDIYLGFNHSTAGLETIVLPAGVTNLEFVSDTPEDTNNGWKKTKLYGTVNGVRQLITTDAYGHSLVAKNGYLFEEWSKDNRVNGIKFGKLEKNAPRVASAGDLSDFAAYGYNPSEWATNKEVYGSKQFGSNITAFSSKNKLPIALTQDVKTLSFYGNSSSSVSGVVGFIIYDGGDAPASYGSAQHIIGNFNKTVKGREVTATQPYIGSQPADVDFRSSVNEPSGAWTLDDLVHTEKYHELSIGADATEDSQRKRVTNQQGDEGVFLITSTGNAVIRKDNGQQIAVKQGEVLTTIDERTQTPVTGIYNQATRMLGIGALPDEGVNQLIDPEAVDDKGEKVGSKEYTLRQASDTEYVLYGVRANPGQYNEKAYLRGWVDFDGNGKFDSYEESELIEVTPDKKTYNIKFKNTPQLLDTSIDKVGIRLRIALPVKNEKGQEEKQLASPTGVEASGEVEDFQTHVVHFPRGTRHESKDYQGQEQTVKIPTNAMFIANGKSKDSGYTNWAQINNAELSPKIVLTDKVVNPATTESVDPNSIKDSTELGNKGIVSSLRKNADGSIYTNADGNVFIDKKDETVLTGKLVKVKDKNNNVLGTALEVVNPNNKKTEYLLAEYNEYDSVGNKVGTYKINPATSGGNKEIAGGFYETTVTFKPEIGFVGKAKGIAIRAWDDNNNSTGWEASDQTIAQSQRSTTLADKDRITGNVNDGVNNYKSMDTTYIPTVIDIKPVGKDETTIDEQGKKQSATPRIPDHGTVESINNEHIDEAKIDKAHVLIDKSKPIKFATTESTAAKTYTEDTKVTEETVVTYEDGGTETFKPVDKIPAGAVVFDKNQSYPVTGTGNITVNKVNYGGGAVPQGAILTGSEPTAPVPVTVLRNGVEVIVPTGEKLKKGDQLVTPLPVHGGAQRTEWTITYQKGETIPGKRTSTDLILANEITVDQLLGKKGDSITFDGKTYTNNNDTIPKGTKTRGTEKDLLTKKLPKATHVNPTTGEVTTVERRYTKVTDTEIVIENEGTYTLVPKTKTNEKGETVYEDAEIVFTPHPSFVGVGTGVTIKQPDVDYDHPDKNDSVRSRYGTDYGYAKYTPTVTPNLTATITRKIHYVYEGDASVPPQDKTPILTIDGKPVTNEQTLTYNRDYIVMSQDGQTEKDITVATEMTLESPITVDRYVRKATGEVVKEATQVTQLKPGDVVKAGTQLPAGTVIVGAWKPINPENDHFTSIISPTLKGYTAEVQLPVTEYTKKENNGVQTHVRNTNSTPVGTYTPTIKDGEVNTKDVGAYDPLVSAVTADNQDDFDVYVYYKADKQVARVVYIDMDATNNDRQGVLEVHTGSTLEAKAAADAQDSSVIKKEELNGDSATRIKYSTAATIAKFEAMGYELKRDGFTNDDNGDRVVGGRKFDEESVADSANAGEKPQNQTFYVFLGHKRDTGAKTEEESVTRTINYKYKKDNTKAADSVTETLNFKREITIDMALAAAEFKAETATFNAENTKATQKEKDDAQRAYNLAEKDYNAAAEKVKVDKTTSTALSDADKALVTAEKALSDAKKANAAIILAAESTQAQRDAKAAAQEAVQAAQTAYDNAVSSRDTARTNYLSANNSDLAKKVVEAQKALDAENVKVAAAKAAYEAKDKDTTASAADKQAALDKFVDAKATAKVAATKVAEAKTALENAQNEAESLKDAKEAEATKNTEIQSRALTTEEAKTAARNAYYDAIIAKVKEEAKKETPDKNKLAVVSFGEWKALGSTATNLPANEQLSDSEKLSDNAFNHVTSPTIAGYVADKVSIDRTDAIDPLAADYSVDVFYVQGEQRATVKFVEVDPTNTNTVVTPGVAEDLVEVGKTGDNFATLTTDAVAATIKKLQDKGYTLVSNGFANPGEGVNNTTFDNDPEVNQEFVVKVKATDVDIPSFDPTKPSSNENPKPTPGVTPIDPSNPSGPKWTEDLIKAVKVQEEVTRTIKYVYEDGTEVPAEKLTDVADKKVKTLTFTRPGKINVVTGEITYGDWSANQTFEKVTSPTIENYTAAVAGVTPTTPDVPTKEVAATDKDIEEVVVYKTKVITVDPNSPSYKEPKKDQPIDPTDPNSPKWTDELLAKLKNTEKVTRTISYVYSEDANKLNQAEKDGNKGGANVVKDNTEVTPFVTEVNFTRVAKVNPVTNEITYEDWKPTTPAGATAPDDTLEGKATVPVIPGYVATADVEKSKTDVTSVKAEDKDITDKVVYEALGKYVPVVPEGFTPPTIENPQYPNNNDDPSKPGDPTTTTTIPYVPGTTPVGPDGQPLKPKVEGDPKQGYVPPAPTTPTGDTTIVYVKDGSQVAVTKFVDVDGKGLEPSVVDTGDTGKAFTKDADVTAAINKILARGYEKVANVNAGEKDYPSTDAEKVFDADAKTNQEFTVTFKPIVKEVPVDPATPGTKPQPGQPVDPSNPTGPKWPNSVKDLKNSDTVKRTIKYVYEDGTPVIDPATGAQKVVEQTAEFTRTANVNLVTGDITYGDWTPAKELVAVASPTATDIPAVANYIVSTATVPAVTVAAEADDITETVVYRKAKPVTITPTDNVPNDDPSTPVDPNNPIQPGKPIDPNNPDGPKWTKDLIDKLRDARSETVTRTITYKYSDVTSELKAEDAAKAGQLAADTVTNTVTFKRPVTIDPITKEFTYGDWVATNGTTLAGKADLPVVAGYVATGDVEASKKNVENVKATDKDITENVVYKTVGKYVPVIPDGITPPANTNVDPKPYNNDPQDGSKVKDPDPTNPVVPGTTTPIVPQIPGTTPVGPDGKPLKPVDSNDLSKGYVPPTPTDPTKDTSIIYVKDGSQVAVVHFVDEKGNSVNESVVETGDTGKEISKSNVDSIKAKLEAKGYEVVAP
ncbi:mucin-binding protein, partial [Streptococcus mitis]|uniref:mucin-binding protein n=1 Tax=Streptococcus mitis TaxID=28037 RepID=UPI0021BD3F35